MRVIEKVFCDLTEQYYFNGLSVEAAIKKATKLLGKESESKDE